MPKPPTSFVATPASTLISQYVLPVVTPNVVRTCLFPVLLPEIERLPFEYVTPATLHAGSHVASVRNVAWPVSGIVIFTVQFETPVQPPPLQPANTATPAAGSALSVTCVP